VSSDGPAFFSLIPLFSWEKELRSDVAYRRWIEERRLQLATEIVAVREACWRGEAQWGSVDDLGAELMGECQRSVGARLSCGDGWRQR